MTYGITQIPIIGVGELDCTCYRYCWDYTYTRRQTILNIIFKDFAIRDAPRPKRGNFNRVTGILKCTYASCIVLPLWLFRYRHVGPLLTPGAALDFSVFQCRF